MWRLLENESFSQAGLQRHYRQAEQLLLWEKAGWTKIDLSLMTNKALQSSDFLIGSQAFMDLWQSLYALKEPRQLLQIVLAMAEMPKELSGSKGEVQEILAKFSPNLSPDSSFWKEFAGLVQVTFPGDRLSAKGDLEKRLHQFRYVISCQQAQWVRDYYKKRGMTDAQALAKYFKLKKRKTWYRRAYDFDLSESARLHNKLAFHEGEIIHPDNQEGANLKIVMGFHTEFILDHQGHFLNEIDPELRLQNGIINGASFNYASKNDHRHRQLDISPVSRHDPQFRKTVLKQGFLAPKLVPRPILKKAPSDWETSYFNKKGFYAQTGLSKYKAVKQAAKAFKELIANA